jgi:hypothetical protein
MCPVCWATALAAFVVYLCVAAFVVVGRDLASVLVAAILGASGLLQRFGESVFLPWWWYVVVACLLLARVGYLLIRHRGTLLVVVLWRRAVDWAIAFRRSRNRTV